MAALESISPPTPIVLLPLSSNCPAHGEPTGGSADSGFTAALGTPTCQLPYEDILPFPLEFGVNYALSKTVLPGRSTPALDWVEMLVVRASRRGGMRFFARLLMSQGNPGA
jgi:hypothetical protein